MAILGVDEHAAAKARSALIAARTELKPLAFRLLDSRTMKREEREDIGRHINSGIVKITTALHNLGVYSDGA